VWNYYSIKPPEIKFDFAEENIHPQKQAYFSLLAYYP